MMNNEEEIDTKHNGQLLSHTEVKVFLDCCIVYER